MSDNVTFNKINHFDTKDRAAIFAVVLILGVLVLFLFAMANSATKRRRDAAAQDDPEAAHHFHATVTTNNDNSRLPPIHVVISVPAPAVTRSNGHGAAPLYSDTALPPYRPASRASGGPGAIHM